MAKLTSDDAKTPDFRFAVGDLVRIRRDVPVAHDRCYATSEVRALLINDAGEAGYMIWRGGRLLRVSETFIEAAPLN